MSLPRATRFLRRSLVGVVHLVRFVVLGHSDIGESVRDLKLFQSSGDVEELFETDRTILISVNFSEDVANSLVVRLESESSHRLAEIVGTDLTIVIGIELSEALLQSSEFVGVEDSSREICDTIPGQLESRVSSRKERSTYNHRQSQGESCELPFGHLEESICPIEPHSNPWMRGTLFRP